MNLIRLEKTYLEKAVVLYQKTFTQDPWFDDDSDEAVERLVLNHMNNNYYLGYGLEDQGKLVGICIGFKKPWIEGMEYYIDQYAIDYEFQHQGLGSEFLRLIKGDLKNLDINAIILNTERGYPSEKFYIKNGFKEIKELVVLVK